MKLRRLNVNKMYQGLFSDYDLRLLFCITSSLVEILIKCVSKEVDFSL